MVSENYYYDVTVAVKTETDRGTIKTIKEQYLVCAVSVVDVEVKMTKEFEGMPNDWYIDKIAVKNYNKILN